MKRQKLSTFLKRSEYSQTSLAKAVGLTQGAISQMLIQDRNVYVIEHDNGKIELEEIIKRTHPQARTA